MTEAAADMRYEQAARFRDQIQALESMRARQKVVLDDLVDRDVLGMARSDDEACCSVLEIREGRLLGKKHHFLGGVMESSDGEILSAFARQFYLQNDFVPPEIHLPAQASRRRRGGCLAVAKGRRQGRVGHPPARHQGADARHGRQKRRPNARRTPAQARAEARPHSPIGLCPPARLAASSSAPPYRRHRHLRLPRRAPGRLGGLLYRRPGQAQPVPLLQNPRPRAARRLRRHPPSGLSPLPRPSRAQRAAARFAAHRRRAGPTRQRNRRLGRARHRRPTYRRPRQALRGSHPAGASAIPCCCPRPRPACACCRCCATKPIASRSKTTASNAPKARSVPPWTTSPGIGPQKRKALLVAFGSVKRIAATPAEEIAALPGFSRKQADALLAHLNSPDHGPPKIDS